MQHPSLTKLYKPTSGLVLYWVGNAILSPKLRPNIPSSSSSFHLTRSLDFIPIYLSAAFHDFFFSFGGEEENWFCIPTGKKILKKTLKRSSRGLEQIDTDEHYIQKNSALASAVDPIQSTQGEETQDCWKQSMWTPSLLLWGKNGYVPNSEQAAFSVWDTQMQRAILCLFPYVTNISMELTTSPQFLDLKAHLSFYCTAYLRVNNKITDLAAAVNLKCCLQWTAISGSERILLGPHTLVSIHHHKYQQPQYETSLSPINLPFKMETLFHLHSMAAILSRIPLKAPDICGGPSLIRVIFFIFYMHPCGF